MKKYYLLIIIIFVLSNNLFAETEAYPKNDNGYLYEKPYKKNRLFLLTAKAGYERYYFHSDHAPHETAYSEIKTDIEPVNLAYFELNFSIPMCFFKSLYKYRHLENGTVSDDERNELIERNIDDPKTQYLLTLAGGFFGIEGSYMRQSFDVGTFEYYKTSGTQQATTGIRTRDELIGKEVFTVYKEQMDLRYHVFWFELPEYGGIKESKYALDFYFGARYVEYSTPVIIYTLDKNSYGMDMVVGESLPQNMVQHLFLFGAGLNNNKKKISRGFNMLFGAEIYGGYGYSFCNLNDYWHDSSYFDADYDSSDDLNKRLNFWSLKLGGNAAIVYCISDSYLITKLKFEWIFDMYMNHIVDKDGYSYETADVPMDMFHSLRLSAEATY